jgi:succinate dehydrogenase hydrophobic anchor subunit
MTGSPAPARRFAGRPDGAPPGYVPGEEDLPLDVLRAPSRAGSLWLLKAASGVLLIGFLGLHLLAQHFFVEGGLRDYDAVVAYLRHPLAIVAEIGLLGSVIVHAALGVRAVLVDLLGDGALRRASWVIGAAAVAAFAYGIGLTLIVLAG